MYIKAQDKKIYIKITSSIPDWNHEENYSPYHCMEIGLARKNEELHFSKAMEDKLQNPFLEVIKNQRVQSLKRISEIILQAITEENRKKADGRGEKTNASKDRLAFILSNAIMSQQSQLHQQGKNISIEFKEEVRDDESSKEDDQPLRKSIRTVKMSISVITVILCGFVLSKRFHHGDKIDSHSVRFCIVFAVVDIRYPSFAFRISEMDEWFSSIRLPGSLKFFEGVLLRCYVVYLGFRNSSNF
ncbi:hypothetical protein Tco_1221609 [Tanacetum coccineum]